MTPIVISITGMSTNSSLYPPLYEPKPRKININHRTDNDYLTHTQIIQYNDESDSRETGQNDELQASGSTAEGGS